MLGGMSCHIGERSTKEVMLEVFIALGLTPKGKGVLSASKGRFTIIALLFAPLEWRSTLDLF